MVLKCKAIYKPYQKLSEFFKIFYIIRNFIIDVANPKMMN